jgi:uncharacterized protein YceK
MMIKKIVLPVLVVSLLCGCTTTSISDSGYQRSSDHRYPHSYESQTEKELDELAVLGVTSSFKFDERALDRALKEAETFVLNSGSRILLLQSGAQFPDSEMVAGLSKYWEISTLSGDNRNYKHENLNQLLRYTAATGANNYIVVYWGVVETAQKNLQTKGVSWIPLVGWSMPDEKTQMRVVLKFAVIDVVSGQWKTFQPTPVEDNFFSSIMDRGGKSQSKEIELKKAVFTQAADELFKRFSTPSNAS